ncbi:MAG: septum formation initiator family protein [Candidatus Lambdaproteobacteria bacterium]|nr:septum formation initiator family protein [Candidatus Lambdaproteobacteria bacterium]
MASRWHLPLQGLARLAAPAWARLRAGGAEILRDRGSAERLPRGFLVFLLVFGAGMILISLVGDQGLIAYLRLQEEARTLEVEIQQLEAHRHDLEREVRALRDDPAYIELLARKRLGLVKPGETVIELPPRGEATR